MKNLSTEEIKDTISALSAYNFVLFQISKSKLRTKKERKNAKDDIIVVGNLIEKYKKILEVLENEN